MFRLNRLIIDTTIEEVTLMFLEKNPHPRGIRESGKCARQTEFISNSIAFFQKIVR